MKKTLLIIAIVVLSATSCSVSYKTYSAQGLEYVTSSVVSATAADLDVSDTKIYYTYDVPSGVSYKGIHNVVAAAVYEALKANGGADVLVEARYFYNQKGGRYTTITVSGYPAKYTNFRSALPGERTVSTEPEPISGKKKKK